MAIARVLVVCVVVALVSLGSAALRKAPVALPEVPAQDEVCNLCLQQMVAVINELLNEGINSGAQDCDDVCKSAPLPRPALLITS